ncbi:hypothetical protein HEP81_03698 [Streptomyces griseofuscus]|uniref:Uncharacterized protein n=1 Tax=Streptomyces griseofuscus TaxID=146922 RepID=A0A7H1Q117_9ACTN|nr:hypothetical protein HEP81_03698 [Streptomyces griseofuscus]
MAGRGRGRRVLPGAALAVPEQVPCAEALEFGGGKLPQGAYGTRCTVQSRLDTSRRRGHRRARAPTR